MKLNIINTLPIYRRMLAEPDIEQRIVIFREELMAGFTRIFQIFGDADPIQMAQQWGLYGADGFSNVNQANITTILDTLEEHNAWTKTADALNDASAAFAPFMDRIPQESITTGLFICQLKTPGTRGYSGFGGIPGYIMVLYDTPDDYNLPRIKGATVHEFNHNIRFAVHPFNPMTVTVGEYVIAEGLAESFAAELYGEDVVGFYVTDFDTSRFEETRAIIGKALNTTGFDEVRGYIFGDDIAANMGLATAGVPPYAGYAMGYYAVQAYLQKTGKSVVEATFVPAEEIIRESGFFRG